MHPGQQGSELLAGLKDNSILAFKSQADGVQIVDANFPVGYSCLAIGGCVNGTSGVVQVPGGWANHSYGVNTNSSAGCMIGAWFKDSLVSEIPQFFTGDSSSMISFYLFRPGMKLTRYDWNAFTGGSGVASPTGINLALADQNSPIFIFGAACSTGSMGSPTPQESMSYNGGNQIQRRDLLAPSGLSIATRVNYHEKLAGLSGLAGATFGAPDLGSRNGHCWAASYVTD